jgi:hypothetical protein
MSYSVIEYESGETIFEQGDAGLDMYLVQGGEVEVLQRMGGVDRQIAVLERGDFFGEMALLEAEPRTSSVRALSASKLIKIDRAGLQHLLERNPEIAVRMIRKLGRRLATAEEMLARALAVVADEAVETTLEEAIHGAGSLVLVADESAFPIPESPEATIGRQDPVNGVYPDIDLTAKDPQFSTSRRHAKILRRGHQFLILEENATNGTYVNGQRISAHHPIPLRSGDVILFGAVQMRFVQA